MGVARRLRLSRRRVTAELEIGNVLIDRFDLVLKRLGGRGVFFDQRRILLRGGVKLRQRLANLFDAARLLGAGVGDIGDRVGDVLHRGDNLAK